MMHISKLHKLLLHNCANIIFRMRVHKFFSYKHFLTLRTTLAHAHSTHRLTGVHGSAHRLDIFVMHKLSRMIFFSMYILNLGSTTATNDCRAREERTRCACPVRQRSAEHVPARRAM